MRIYEFAKEKGLSSKDLIVVLKDAGFDVSNHMSILTDDAAAFLNKKFGKALTATEPKKEKTVPQTATPKVAKATPLKKQAPLAGQELAHSEARIEKKVTISPSVAKSAEAKPAQAADVVLDEAPAHSAAPARPQAAAPARTATPARGGPNRSGGKARPGQFRRPAQQQKKGHTPAPNRFEPRPAVVVPLTVTEITITRDMPLFEAAELMGKGQGELILSLLKKGTVCNRNHLLKVDAIAQLAAGYGITVNIPEKKVVPTSLKVVRSESDSRIARWPIVVVMGHVDHGKTTLLDYLRKSNVAAREKGGITQHLGAYEVESKHGKVIFLDTPGHEAFTAMRTRGVKVTDIAVLMVAADDGIMPQTIEALEAAKAAGVPIIVAINKVDKVTSSTPIETIKRQLAQHDLLTEDWGGSVICVPISAKTGQGVDDLVEMIVLQSQMMDLTADVTLPAKAFVLESRLDRGYGAIATVICTEGSIKQGDYFVSGETTGKVRLLINSAGERISQAGPSVPVQVVGFDKFATLGDVLMVVSAVEYNKAKSRGPEAGAEKAFGTVVATSKDGKKKDDTIKLMIKTDTYGSREAIAKCVGNFIKANKEFGSRLHVTYSGIGDITEGDVISADDMNAIIVALHIKVERNAMSMAKDKGVEIEQFGVIYHMTEYLDKLATRNKKIVMITTKVGEAIVRKVFPLKDGTVIAGCYVTEGVISRGNKVVCMRDRRKAGESKIASLQRDRKVVKEVHGKFECGFISDSYHEWQVDDVVECYAEVAQK
jgi:translation initiation factor IF-2